MRQLAALGVPSAKKFAATFSANVPRQTGGRLGISLFYSRIFRHEAIFVPQPGEFFCFPACIFHFAGSVKKNPY